MWKGLGTKTLAKLLNVIEMYRLRKELLSTMLSTVKNLLSHRLCLRLRCCRH